MISLPPIKQLKKLWRLYMVDYTNESSYGTSRMSGSFALIRGKPKYINTIGNDNKVYYGDLNTGIEGKVWSEKCADLKDMNNSELRLGFVNNPLRLMYVSRVPSRQWRQGIRQQSLIDLFTLKNVSVSIKGFSETLQGIFPVIGDCMELIECEESKAVAFCNKYAIGKKTVGGGFVLKHRNLNIGTISLSKYNIPNFNLEEEFRFLNEDVEDRINHV